MRKESNYENAVKYGFIVIIMATMIYFSFVPDIMLKGFGMIATMGIGTFGILTIVSYYEKRGKK